ncbi:PDC sensor domain-containing protein [Alteromonadaceae bacterium BrNp21-10]|nr:PDC sensor domain-containing protein [Alteromonadaceae bacterium BrNp21-10]
MTTYLHHHIKLALSSGLCWLLLSFSVQAEASFVMSPEYKKALFVSHANVLQNTIKRDDVAQLLLNTLPNSIIDLLKKDEEWQDNSQLQQQVLGNSLALYFKQLIADKNYSFAEIMLTDANGALVAAFPKTSDYWQGDEQKFVKPAISQKVHFSEPNWDESSKAYSFFVSIPVVENNKVIGILISAMDVTSSYVFEMSLEELIEVSIATEE